MIAIPMPRAIWTPPGGAGDPAWATVVNLTHFNGANGASTFPNFGTGEPFTQAYDSSTDVISTAQYVFGGSSLRRGASGGCVAGAAYDTAHYAFGTEDFTIEFRFRPDAVQTANVFDMRVNGGGSTPAPTIYTLTDGSIIYYHTGADRIVSSAGVISAAAWSAVALSRVAGTTRLFVDGVQVGSDYTDATDYTSSSQPRCGSYTSQQTNAYYTEVRISNGVFGAGAGRYATNYSIATSAFPDF